jgi:hypothetical protein
MAADSVDPLSLLAGNCSSSDSEEDETLTIENTKNKIFYTPTTQANSLPSPDTLFSTVSQPHFLTTHIDPHHVNWDKLVKSADPLTDQSKSSKAQSTGKFAAIPPPTQQVTSNLEICKPPVKYDIPTYDKEEEECLEKGSGGNKRPPLSDDEDSSSKKPKVETFRDKEKRKRDLGMCSRGKNFVEEEKRILREQYKQ